MLRGANKRAQNLLETQCVGLGRRGKAPYIGASERWVPSSGSNNQPSKRILHLPYLTHRKWFLAVVEVSLGGSCSALPGSIHGGYLACFDSMLVGRTIPRPLPY